jgi:hypothetical protein
MPEDAPPLPAAPPPEPMWNTFPGKAPVDEEFYDDEDDFAEIVSDDPINNDPTTKLRTDMLRRKSEFLGLKMEETEEYKKMKAGTLNLVFILEAPTNRCISRV